MKKRKKEKKDIQKKVPSIYLDTDIIRTIIEKKPPKLLNLLRIIKERKWQSFTSTFGVLELFDLKKDDIYLKKKVIEKAEYKTIIRGRDKKELNQKELDSVELYVREFFKKYSFVISYQIPKEAWLDAMKIAFISNIHCTDILHLAAALNLQANIFLTKDGFFIKEANLFLRKYKLNKKIKVVHPDGIFDAIQELGFDIED